MKKAFKEHSQGVPRWFHERKEVFDCSQSTFENKEPFHKSDFLRKVLQRRIPDCERNVQPVVIDMLKYRWSCN